MSTRVPLRKAALLLPIVFLLLLAPSAARTASADGIIIPHPPPDRPMRWRDVPLAVKHHRVDVAIENQVATTYVDQVFVNHGHFPVEGTYLFPLPLDAAVSSFDMTVDGRKLEGRLLSKDEARAIYERIVREQRDPALLEYVGRGAFQASIFPIPPGEERRIELTYTQVLAKDAGLVHYRYPLNTEKFSTRPLQDVAVTVRVKDKFPIRAVYSPSHEVSVQRDGETSVTVGYEESNVLPDRDFDLYYSVSEDVIDVNLLTYKPAGEDGFFLLLVTPPLESEPVELVSKDVIIVLDTSGSMEGEKLAQAKQAARYVLDQLREGDRFGLISFSSSVRSLSGAPLPVTARQRGHEFVDGLVARGSTDINRALLEAAAGADPKRTTILILLTDGQPTSGEIDPERILGNARRSFPDSVRLFPFGIGYDVDAVLLDKLSSEQRGASGYVRPGEQIDEAVSELYSKVDAPVLTDVTLAFAGVQAEDLYPYPMPDLFAGTQLAVLGRYRDGGTGSAMISGRVGDRTQAYRYTGLSFARSAGDDFIARLWAQRKIGYLLSQIRINGPSDELIAEIVDLSTRYGIVTPYTSFLVEEPELVLSTEGRRELTSALQSPGYGGGYAASEQPRSGEAAVDRALAEKQLFSADRSGGSVTEQVKHVGDVTFLLRGGAWTDTRYDETRMRPEKVVFGSERYFALLRQSPELGRFMALGDHVVIVLGPKVVEIVPS